MKDFQQKHAIKFVRNSAASSLSHPSRGAPNSSPHFAFFRGGDKPSGDETLMISRCVAAEKQECGRGKKKKIPKHKTGVRRTHAADKFEAC